MTVQSSTQKNTKVFYDCQAPTGNSYEIPKSVLDQLVALRWDIDATIRDCTFERILMLVKNLEETDRVIKVVMLKYPIIDPKNALDAPR